MAVEVGTGYVSITPSAKGFGSSLSKEIGGDLEGVGKSAGGKAGKGFMGGMGGALKVGIAAAGIGAVAGIATKALGAAREAQQITNITEATIKATGGAAGVTATHVQDMANALQRSTGISDETIRSGSNIILTFKNIANAAGDGNDIFDQTTKAALDLSAAGFGSVESASTMLGKALNDPLKGMSALTRVGVTFTDQQREQVEAAMANNDILGAQKIILAEVEGQVGGVAEAAADPMDKLTNMFNDLLETIGGALLPALSAIADALQPVFDALGPVIGEVAELLGGILADTVKDLAPLFGPLATIVGKLANALGGILGKVIRAVAPLIVMLMEATMPLLDVVLLLLEPILELVAVLLEALMPIIKPLITLIAALVGILGQGLGRVIEKVIAPALSFVAGLIEDYLGPAFESIGEFLKPVIDFMENTAGPVIMDVWDSILEAVMTFVDWFKGVAMPVIEAIIGFIIGYYQTLWSVVQTVWNAITGFISTAVSRITSIFNTINDVVIKVIGFFQNLWNGVRDRVSGMLDFLREIPGRILGFFSGLASQLFTIGKNIIQGMINGIGSMASALINFVRNFIQNNVVGAIKNFFGISSPSKLMAGLGEDIGDGLVVGIMSKTGEVRTAMRGLSANAFGAATPGRFSVINGGASSTRLGAGGMGVAPRGGLVIQSLNVTSAPNERAEDSVPRALRRMAFVSGL
jgi:phage-related protein